MFWSLVIDGACSGNPGPGGYAALLHESPGTSIDRIAGQALTGHAPRTTSNAMELMALITGLRATPAGAQVLVITDSELIIGWLRKGWKRRDSGLRPLLAQADRLIAERTVDFEKVAGHGGHPWNDQADRLARGEVERARSCRCERHPIDELLGDPLPGLEPAFPVALARSLEEFADLVERRELGVDQLSPDLRGRLRCVFTAQDDARSERVGVTAGE